MKKILLLNRTKNGEPTKGSLLFLLATILLFSIEGYSQGVPELMYFKFNASSTNVSNDANPSTALSTTGNIGGGLTQGGTGQFGGALLGGSGSASDIFNTNAPLNLTGSWTMSMWISGVISSATIKYIFGTSTAGSSTGFRCFTGGAVGAGNLTIRGGTNMTNVDAIGIFDAIGSPVVVTIVYNNSVGNISVYRNGIFLSSTTQPPTLAINTASNNFLICPTGISGLLTGQSLDEFRLYNRALPASEITSTWNIELGGSSAANDAGIQSIIMPTDFCGDQFQDIKVRLKNFGTNVLNSATVAWEVNGQGQSPLFFSGMLDTMGGSGPNDTLLTLGSYFFSGSTLYNVVAWPDMPNSVPDTVNNNDTASVSFTTKPTPQPPPVIQNPNVAVCSGSSALLSATGTGTITWYSDSALTQLAGIGNNILSGPVTGNTTYYAANDLGSTGYAGPVSPSSVGIGSGTSVPITTYHISFNVLSPVKLVSVDVFPTAAIGSSASITIQNSSNATLITVPYVTTVTGGNTPQTVTINLSLAPGTGYKMGQGTNVGLFRNTAGAVYPYTLPGIISITGNNFNPVYYFYFYNWQITTGTGCPGVAPVDVSIVPVAPTPDFIYTVNNNVVQFTNLTNSGATYSWDFGDATTSTAANPTKTYSATGIYFVTLTASNACVSNSQSAPQIVEINTMGIDTEAASSESIQIYPNPSGGRFSIVLGGQAMGSDIVIIDLQGREVKRLVNVQTDRLEVDASDIQRGMYLVHIQIHGRTVIVKHIVN